MKIQGHPWRTIWPVEDAKAIPIAIEIIDQTRLPHELVVCRLESVQSVVQAIKTMQVRGAPLIGATAAYGMALGATQDASDAALRNVGQSLVASRPTAVNLRWAVERMLALLQPLPVAEREAVAWQQAAAICDEDVALNQAIGRHGCLLIQQMHQRKKSKLNILTHCNAGWLATVDWGYCLSACLHRVRCRHPCSCMGG